MSVRQGIQTRNEEAANRHVSLIFLAYSSLMLGVTECKIAKSAIRSSVASKVKATIFQLLEKFILWIYNIKSIEGLMKVVEEFKYRLS